MNIAVIDDEEAQRSLLVEYLDVFGRENALSIRTSQFSSGNLFLKDFKAVYDIIIFDVDMPGMSGIETAKAIREKDGNVIILFVTNMAQYAINGYEVDAVDYIIKPVGYYDFSLKFTKAARKARQREDRILVLDCTDGLCRVPVSDVCYVEVMGHYLIYYTKESAYKVRGSMKEHEEELATYSFVRIHKSYLIHMKYVENLKSGEVQVNGKTLPVGRSYKDHLLQEYMAYLRG